jgi:hypothetical protein
MVAKLDDSGNGFVESSVLYSGTFNIDVDLTNYDYNEKIRLRFYSNYSGDKLET